MKSVKSAKLPSEKKPALTKKALEFQQPDISNIIKQGGSKFLSTLKQRSLRRNTWYRVLSLEKRRFVDAVIQTVDKIRSSLLLKILTSFVEKLLAAMGGLRGLIGDLTYGMQNYGQPLAQKISIIAKNWGNKTATNWASDKGFIRYLTVIDMNNLPIFKINKL